MDRTAKLVEAAEDLTRRLWASLPWHVRLADFLLRVAVSPAEAFGIGIYSEFAKHGITGIPDNYKREAQAFGKRAYTLLLSKYRNPRMAEEILSEFLLRFMEKGSAKLNPGTDVKAAENYVLTGVVREGINQLRSMQRRREDPDVYFSNSDEEVQRETPVFDQDNDETLLIRALSKMRPKLERIHPDAALYLKLSLIDGYKDRQIIGDPAHGVKSMLPHPFSSQGKPLNEASWNLTYKKPIMALVKSHFSEQYNIAV